MRQPSTSSVSRRDFVKGSAAATAIGTLELGHGAYAAGSDEIKIALVGCGGRGTGAAADALGNHTHSNIKLIAMADAFAEPIERAHQDLQNQFHDKVDVPPDRRFVGLDAYEKAIAAGADIVLLCTPPGFRPAQFAAAVKAGQARVHGEAGGRGRTRLSCGAGPPMTRPRRKGCTSRSAITCGTPRTTCEAIRQIHDGLIGDLLYTRAYFNTQGIWNRPRQPGMTEMQYQVNNWYHFVWLSGDHLVEQHVHGIDACNWIAEGLPVQATGIGGRQVRAEPGIGEIFDHHCVQYTYGDGSHSFSECRQQPGTWSNFSHHAHGTKGSVSFEGGDAVTIHLKGSEPKRLKPGRDGHQTEWDDLLAVDRRQQPLQRGSTRPPTAR